MRQLFGDSITHGGGAISYSPCDWEYSFQTYLQFPLVNLGKSGDTSGTMRERFEKDVLPYKPKFLIIMGGSNSLRGGTPGRQVINDLAAIRDKCYKYDIRPIFLTLPPINPQLSMMYFKKKPRQAGEVNWIQSTALSNNSAITLTLNPTLAILTLSCRPVLPLMVSTLILRKKLMTQIINSHWPQMTR